MNLSRILLMLFLLVLPVAAWADDTQAKISEMISDLGNNKQNNGVVQKCMDGGTKKITIKRGKYGTTYEGVYKKCKEPGRVRDGNVQITLG
jgi:hypothetical protein